MVMTVLEARVPEENWPALQQAFAEADASRPRGIGLAQTFLVQSVDDEEIWQVISVWSSWDALHEARRSGQPPRGLQIFHKVNAEPEASIFEVIQRG
jgi:hypothetical protein